MGLPGKYYYFVITIKCGTCYTIKQLSITGPIDPGFYLLPTQPMRSSKEGRASTIVKTNVGRESTTSSTECITSS